MVLLNNAVKTARVSAPLVRVKCATGLFVWFVGWVIFWGVGVGLREKRREDEGKEGEMEWGEWGVGDMEDSFNFRPLWGAGGWRTTSQYVL